MNKKAIIIGAGPAGLTAAYELLKRTDITPIVLEKSGQIGGISRTTNYKGNRMDMGPHRFFSKSDRVMNWWLSIMPLQEEADAKTAISYHNNSRVIEPEAREPKDSEKVMLLIHRLTRIYFLRRFFEYPIKLSVEMLRKLGIVRTVTILLSFLYVRVFPRKPEKSLEDFIINKFGKKLYLLFFKDYTEKVWGIAASHISAEWGAQRIKGVSLSKAIGSAIKSMVKHKTRDINQRAAETSLIEQFLYPRRGPGSLWEEVARQVEEMGGKVYLNQDVQRIYFNLEKVEAVSTVNYMTGQTGAWEGDYFFSTMPVQELIGGMGEEVPADVRDVAAGLVYRDFINVGVLVRQISTGDGRRLDLKDNWIYIQERDVKVGRVMIYNNWGGGMVKDPNSVWLGMEYFCNKSDALWTESDEAIQRLAIGELVKMDLARVEDVLDSTVQRMEKTYPAYFGTYDRFHVIRNYTDQFENLFLIGRNGMHKYNNSDHSSLCAMTAVDNIVAGVTSKANLWEINTEQEYHEQRKSVDLSEPPRAQRETVMPFLIDYLWANRLNRSWCIASLTIFLLQFVIFKFRYPFANYMPDSYSYLEAAATNVDVNMWPVAYSKFLRLISALSHSDKVVTAIQYLFLQTSALLFLFTLCYWLRPGRYLKSFLFVFLIMNPLPLYISNYISADAVFFGFSLLWMTCLIWIIFRPRPYQIVWQAILLLACFNLRYNAIYYPIIAGLAFVLSPQAWSRKVTGFALGTGMVMLSIIYTTQKTQMMTGERLFSAFAGWQLANNALYMYQHIPVEERGAVPVRFAKLETMVRAHLDTLRKVKFTKQDSARSYFYLWSGKGPLIQYMLREWKKDTATPYFKRWAAEGPLYSEYAGYLIRKYPLAFAKYFLLPNAVKYLTPPSEFLGTYNMGGDSVGKLAKEWFNYKSQKIRDDNKLASNIGPVEWYPVFSMITNVFLLIVLVGMIVFQGFRDRDARWTRAFLLVMAFWLSNACFSIFASPVVLRYQAFPIIVCFTTAVISAGAIYESVQRSDLSDKAKMA